MIKHKLAYIGLLTIFWLVMRLYLFRATAILFYMLLIFLPMIFLLFRISAHGIKVELEVPVQVVKKGRDFVSASVCRVKTAFQTDQLLYGSGTATVFPRNGKRKNSPFTGKGRKVMNFLQVLNIVRNIYFC